MSVYQKLQSVKVILQEKNFKKTGINTHRDFKYFELTDFLPTIVIEFDTIGLCSYVSFDNDYAMLTIVDSEKPDERIVITSPMKEGQIPRCTPMQNLGGVETYQRRYLYMSALDIVELDTLDPATGSQKESEPTGKSEEVDENNIHYCEDCDGEIYATAKSSVETLIAKSQKWYQANLCGPCANKRYKAGHPDA